MQNYTEFLLNDTGYYHIPQSALWVYKFQIAPASWLKITAAHTNFYSNQTWSIRLWVSDKPGGESISAEVNSNDRWISPLKLGQSIGFRDVFYPQVNDKSLSWQTVIPSENPFWINIRNMENKNNAFYLKLDYLPIYG